MMQNARSTYNLFSSEIFGFVFQNFFKKWLDLIKLLMMLVLQLSKIKFLKEVSGRLMNNDYALAHFSSDFCDDSFAINLATSLKLNTTLLSLVLEKDKTNCDGEFVWFNIWK